MLSLHRKNTFSMKFILKYFGFVALMALIACNSSDDEYNYMINTLQQAENIYQHPDGKRYDYPEADTIQISYDLAKATVFFVDRKDYENAAKTSLYYGYSKMENNDRTSAMTAFKNAENYSKITGDTLIHAHSIYNIARLLFIDNMLQDAIKLLNIADTLYCNNYLEKSHVQNLLALSYCRLKDYNNADIYINKSIEYAHIANSPEALWSIINNQSVIYREQEDYDKAITILLQNRNDTDSTHMLMFDLNLGSIYLYDDQYDSAAYYIHKALDIAEVHRVKPETKVTIYFYLYYILKKQGDFQQSLAYHEKHESLQYQIMKENETKNIYRIQQQYDYEVLQNNLNQKIINRQRIILIISLLLLSVSIVVIILLLRQKNILKENKEIKQELDITKEKLQQSVRPEVVEKDLSRQLHLIITANRINERAKDYIKEWGPLIYRINNEKASMFEAAATAIERVYPDMYSVINQKYPDLNDTESKVLLLSCSDLTNTEIGYILGLSVHSVNKSRSEIRKKIVK